MTDLPETIWGRKGDSEVTNADVLGFRSPANGANETEYVRADLARARVAAAYEAAVQEIEAFRGEEDVPRTDKAVLSDQTCNDCCDLIRALTDADARAALDRLLAEARAQAWKEAADMFHTEQVRIWAQEILEGLALANVLRVETYDEKVDAFSAVQKELFSIGAAIRARGAAQEGEE